MKFEFRTVKCNNFNALISNLMVRKLPGNLTRPKIMLSHHGCLEIPSNDRETRNARSSAGQATKTIRFYVENHAGSTPPLHDSSTLRPTYLGSKGSCAYILRTPLGFPKRLPDKESLISLLCCLASDSIVRHLCGCLPSKPVTSALQRQLQKLLE